jgi:ubiquitin C-terminal hydrolase
LGRVNSVEQALQKYFTDEVLSHDERWRCSACGKMVTATKSLRLSTVSETLILNLKRFDSRGSKIHDSISFNERLQISISGVLMNFKLVAVVVHLGSTT